MRIRLVRGQAVSPAEEADSNGHIWTPDWLSGEGFGFRCVLCRVPGYREAEALSRCARAGGSTAGLTVGVAS